MSPENPPRDERSTTPDREGARLAHQATGMIAVQVRVSASDALTRPRTVTRQVRFHPRHQR